MSKVFAGFLAATLLVLAVGCSGSDDDALVECVNVLADVARDHNHGVANSSSATYNGGMPKSWKEDNGVEAWFGGRSIEDVIDEKCAPFLSVSAIPAPGSAAPVELWSPPRRKTPLSDYTLKQLERVR